MRGIEGSSYIQEGGAMGLWLLHIFYGDSYISITLSNTKLSHVDSEYERRIVFYYICSADNILFNELYSMATPEKSIDKELPIYGGHIYGWRQRTRF